MTKLAPKRVSDSMTSQVQIIMPEHINGYHRLFGGQLVEWIDVVAGVVARRHSNRNVTTAFIDHLHFKAPAYANDTVVIKGRITYVGRTSMEVRVDTFVESLNGERKLVNRAYLVTVALDDDEKPVEVPKLILETPEDEAEWEAGSAGRKKKSSCAKLKKEARCDPQRQPPHGYPGMVWSMVSQPAAGGLCPCAESVCRKFAYASQNSALAGRGGLYCILEQKPTSVFRFFAGNPTTGLSLLFSVHTQPL